jgi:hypothetical protein
MKKHELKIYPEYFWPVLHCQKTFEIRRNDIDFQVGDILVLKEYNPLTESYSGFVVEKTITYITDYAQKENYVVLGII